MGWEHRIPDIPKAMDPYRRAQMMAYVISEILEFGNSSTLLNQLDALADAMYFIIDAFLEMGVDPDDVYKIIHKSNMSKKGDNGPNLDESKVPPKLIKPPDWVDPKDDIRNYIRDMVNFIIRERRNDDVL
jgi:predicted HAD superfamily Cof-like phosphohydrolase